MNNEEKLRDPTELTKLTRKLEKEYVTDMYNLSKKELDEKLLALAKEEQEIVTTRSNDGELEKAINHKRSLDEPHREQLKMNKIRKRFVSLLIKEKK